LTKVGAEAVGGVVVVRHGFNPLAAIKNVQAKIARDRPTLPAQAVVDYTRTSQAELETFAHAHGFAAFTGGALNHGGVAPLARPAPRTRGRRGSPPAGFTLCALLRTASGLIYETLGTLNAALYEQVWSPPSWSSSWPPRWASRCHQRRHAAGGSDSPSSE
jgi:Cu(I)/Ag(I) efflux system membrane protein CusA/SilA